VLPFFIGPIPKRAPTSTVRHKLRNTKCLLDLSAILKQATVPQPRAVRGQQQDLNTPPSGRQRCYSSLPSKHIPEVGHKPWDKEGFTVSPIPATQGRTQLTPSARRSDGAELIGVATSIFGISCSVLLVVIFTSWEGVNFFVEL
jgi:hypothetical protein